MNKSKRFDVIAAILTYASTAISIFILFSILIFTLFNGIGLLSFDLFTNDYNTSTYSFSVDTNNSLFLTQDYIGDIDDMHYSVKWGIGLTDSIDTEGSNIVVVSYIHEDSLLLGNVDNGGNIADLKVDCILTSFVRTNSGSVIIRDGAKQIIDLLDNSDTIDTFAFSTVGGGIRGSLFSTITLIITTLIIVVPFGILASIYINEYAKKNKFLKVLQSMIDMLSGVPSVIFGLMGAAVFIPLVNNLSNKDNSTGSILAGALTMSVILLPVIIKTTIEGLKSVPNDLRQASLALGASETQTTFKVVLPNAVGSISTGVILAIGRIVGESAALIFVMGTVISDSVSLTESSTSLSVHIWSVMSGESPNFELASSIALIILVFVLGMNLSVKFITKKFNKFKI